MRKQYQLSMDRKLVVVTKWISISNSLHLNLFHSMYDRNQFTKYSPSNPIMGERGSKQDVESTNFRYQKEDKIILVYEN